MIISLWELYICSLDWLYLLSVQQRRKYFLPCRTLLFSLLPGRKNSSCVFTLSISFSFYRGHKILSEPDGLVSTLDIWFLLSNLLPCGLGPFHSTWHMSIALCKVFPLVSIFLAFETPQKCWDILFNPLKTIANLLLGSMELIKCHDVGVSLDLFFAFSNRDSFDVCRSLFSKWCCHLLCCSQSQLRIFDNSFGCVKSFVWICSAFGRVETFHF